MGRNYILSIDQGTTGTRVFILDRDSKVISHGYREFTQIYPKAGWVEHDPQEIWAVTLGVAKQAMLQANISSNQISAIGITNQRETTVVWDKNTGIPVCNAIVWQCRRTSPLCDEMKNAGMENLVQDRTGLVIDAYFSSTKIAWILENIPDARKKAESGDLLFGTIDTWLLWKLSGGKVHITDYSNASRTMLFNIYNLSWEDELLRYFNIPNVMLPDVAGSSQLYSVTDTDILGSEIPVTGLAGDQQAALFGQTCFDEGCAKNTYGTGCFLLMNTGNKPIKSKHGMLTTIAWGLNNEIFYALEGSVFIAGAAIQWLRDGLQIINTATESENLATSIINNDGVYLVPAFVGLGAPYWDMHARGTLVGLTRGSGRAHLCRAALESIAYQTWDVIEAMQADAGFKLSALNVDGGASANNFLMQFQADLLGVPVERPVITDSTAIGAAFLAGLAVGYWSSTEELKSIRKIDKSFTPNLSLYEKEKYLAGWKEAIKRTLSNT